MGLNDMKRMVRNLVSPIASRIAPVRWKEFNELYYWQKRKKSEGVLTNDHYCFFYTTHFDLPDPFFTDKVILDIGCGPGLFRPR